MKSFLRARSIFPALFLGLVAFTSCSTPKNIVDPEYRDIKSAKIKDVGLLKTTAEVDMVFYNPNDYSIELSSARGDVYIDNAFFGHFDMDTKVAVKKNSEFILPVTFKLDNIGAVSNQSDIYKRKEAKVRIEGMARVKKSGFTKDIPIAFDRVQNIERLRALVTR
jgi:LEA14-like dessication related protein